MGTIISAASETLSDAHCGEASGRFGDKDLKIVHLSEYPFA
jgi:hypothetical protein